MLSAVRSARAPARETLFPECPLSQHPPHFGALCDALVVEINVALGIEAALQCPDLEGDLLKGVQEIARVHVDRLRAIGRLVEEVRDEVRR